MEKLTGYFYTMRHCGLFNDVERLNDECIKKIRFFLS